MSTRGIRLTDRDRMILAFAAEHRIVLTRQLEALTGTDVSKRMRQLARTGHVEEGKHLPLQHYLIREAGLVAIGSTLKPPRPKLDEYKHDIGLAWLWLGAHRGAFGPVQEVLSERRLRWHDGVRDRPPEPVGVRLGGIDRYGNETLHYPDLVLIAGRGGRLAIELELSRKGRERLDAILGGYGSDGRIDRVLYLVEDNPEGKRLGGFVSTAAREMGLSPLVHVERIKPIRTMQEDTRPPAPRRTHQSRRTEASLDR